MVFLFEVIILCILFTIALIGIAKDPLSGIHNYPPAIIQRVKELGLITDEQFPKSKKTIMKKLLAAVVIAIILGAIVYFVNGADTFGEGLLVPYQRFFKRDGDWFTRVSGEWFGSAGYYMVVLKYVMMLLLWIGLFGALLMFCLAGHRIHYMILCSHRAFCSCF